MKTPTMILMLALIVFAAAPLPLRAIEPPAVTQASEPQTGTWGDQGDGTYRNPTALGKLDNTIILFFSDNTTLGGKGTCYDGGARTPCFLWGQGRVPKGVVCDKLVQNIDFVPTIFDFAGIRPPPEMKLDGMSLVPLIANPQTKWREQPIGLLGREK